MKMIIGIVVLILSHNVISQKTFTGVGKIKDKLEEINYEDSLHNLSIIQRKSHNFAVITYNDKSYSLHKEKFYVIKDSIGSELLWMTSNGKTIETKDGDKFDLQRCRKSKFCVVDKTGQTVGRGTYKFRKSRYIFSITLERFDPILISMLTYKLLIRIRQEIEASHTSIIF
jgi:hypothetical protein